MKDFKVIDFKWGTRKKVIWSRTGLMSDSIQNIQSEGMISYNSRTKKIVWLEYQIDKEVLFEGEYRILGNNMVQREYTVHYEVGYKNIPFPEEEGWIRLYRETFTPTSENTIDWSTETYIGGQWIKTGSNRKLHELGFLRVSRMILPSKFAVFSTFLYLQNTITPPR